MEELDKYYGTKKSTFILPDGTETDAYAPVYKAPLGDLIEDFVHHIKTPWWRRKKGHDELTQIYKEWLNSIEIEREL